MITIKHFSQVKIESTKPTLESECFIGGHRPYLSCLVNDLKPLLTFKPTDTPFFLEVHLCSTHSTSPDGVLNNSVHVI